MVIYEYCFIWIPELRKAHFFKLFCYKWNKYIMNHNPVYIDRYNVSRLYCFSNIVFYNFLNNCLAHFPLLSKSIQPIQFAHGFYKSASLNNAHQIFRKRSNRVLFSIVIYMFIHYHSDFITFFDIIMKIWLLDQ